MCSRVPDIKHTILLIGGGKDGGFLGVAIFISKCIIWNTTHIGHEYVVSGPAALVCAEILRQNCYQGRIIMITKDNLPPFDKPKLSKVRSQSEMIRSLYSCARVSDHPLSLNEEVSWFMLVRFKDEMDSFRLWMWRAATSSSVRLTFISSMGLRCGHRRR